MTSRTGGEAKTLKEATVAELIAELLLKRDVGDAAVFPVDSNLNYDIRIGKELMELTYGPAYIIRIRGRVADEVKEELSRY